MGIFDPNIFDENIFDIDIDKTALFDGDIFDSAIFDTGLAPGWILIIIENQDNVQFFGTIEINGSIDIIEDQDIVEFGSKKINESGIGYYGGFINSFIDKRLEKRTGRFYIQEEPDEVHFEATVYYKIRTARLLVHEKSDICIILIEHKHFSEINSSLSIIEEPDKSLFEIYTFHNERYEENEILILLMAA